MICDRCGDTTDDGRSIGDCDGAEWICHACRTCEADALRAERRRVKYDDAKEATTLERLGWE